ncbi:MAG: cardiolipin synthase ClsB [Zoogloeaceae bacterium]|jgi:cardiolipin synthase|nr:cardiolipin synthase ClsB [Zoogloeaceae bacterium]
MKSAATPTFLTGNRLQLLESGREYFPALLAELQAATREILLETYIFADDAAGRAVALALEAAARRGVVVRVLVDGFGARHFPQTFGRMLTAAGGHWRLYRREIARFSLSRHRLRRLHRKIVVVDGRIAFVGGINIADDATPLGADLPGYDYAVRLEGALVAVIQKEAAKMWGFLHMGLRGGLLPSHSFPIPAPAESARREAPDPVPLRLENVRAAFLLRDNLRHRRDIAQAYLRAIRSARHAILIANAYFLPGFHFRRALREAARRGVVVTVLLQGASDHPLVRYATQGLYAELLAEGVRIFEYRQGFLHAKVAVTDGHWATVGSSNIDPFSLLLAREANLVIEDSAFAAHLESCLRAAMAAGACELTCDALARQPLWQRLLRRASHALARFLLSFSGYGL